MENKEEQKKLLIIKSHPQSLGPVEGFLKNRSWTIKSTSNLKEALVYLVQEQPQFVMISIDHPNRKVRNLPKVLGQALPVCVIAFSESSTSASIKTLSDCAAGYAIFHPVTGPAVERTVNKYYKDLQTNPNAFANRGNWNGTGKDSGMISIRGEGGDGATDSTQNFLASLMGIDAGTMTSGSNDSLSGTMSGSPDNMMTGMAGEEKSDLMTGSSMLGHLAPMNSKSNPLSPDYDGPMIADEAPKELPPTEKRTDSGWSPVQKNSTPGQRPGIETRDANDSSDTTDSIFVKGTRDALERACVQKPGAVPEVIHLASNVACIMVESARFSGYLVAAMAKDQFIDMAFIEKIRTRLFKFLRDNGELIAENENMSIKIKQVPFMPWALEYAEFLRRSIHEGNEVAIAFFPREDLKVAVLESSDEDMAAVNIHELEADVPVDFNLYIHLPRNNRYVLYTPCGGTFYSSQKERLVAQGVGKLHILRLEMSGLDKYRAQNFLNDKIEEFEAKAKEKVPV